MAEARGGGGNTADRQLQLAYRNVFDSGTHWFNYKHHQRALTSNKIKIRRKSCNIAGLQLADILANPVKTSILVQNGLLQINQGTFGQKLYQIAATKFNRNYRTNVVKGYGWVIL